jgi:hypothetical protein
MQPEPTPTRLDEARSEPKRQDIPRLLQFTVCQGEEKLRARLQ